MGAPMSLAIFFSKYVTKSAKGKCERDKTLVALVEVFYVNIFKLKFISFF